MPEYQLGGDAAADNNAGAVTRTQADIDAELSRLDELNAELGDDDGLEIPGLPARTADVSAAARSEVDRAARKGWTPKEKWVAQGKDPKDWVDAITFNKRGDAFTHNLQAEVEALKKKLADFEGTQAAFVEFQKGLVKKKDEELKVALTQLRLQRSEAIRNGEDEEALVLEDRIDAIKEQNRTANVEIRKNVKVPTEAENMVVTEWIADGNQWFQDDGKLRDYAVALGDRMIAAGETDRGRKFLDKVAAKMREEFPRSFRTSSDSASRPNNRVSGGGNGDSGGSGNSNGKTARDLPSADRALMRQFIADGMYTEKEFLDSYFARN